MTQQQNITTIFIPDPNGGQPQMIKVLGNPKFPLHLTTGVGPAGTVKTFMKTSDEQQVTSVIQSGKLSAGPVITLPSKQVVNTVKPVVLPIGAIQLRTPVRAVVEGQNAGVTLLSNRHATLSSPVVIRAASAQVPTSASPSSTTTVSASPTMGGHQQQATRIVPASLPVSAPVTFRTPSHSVSTNAAQQISTKLSQSPVLQTALVHQNQSAKCKLEPGDTAGGSTALQIASASPPKSFINTSILDHSGTRKKQHDFDFDYHIESKRRKTEKGGKGLRHFSMKVCEKVKAKGTTSYNEVADELVSEFADQNRASSPSETINYDQKNIRRRVYDALNVLMAMNIISKEKKEIRWLGLPTNSAQECRKLEQERRKRMERIRMKRQQLQDLILQQIAFKNLVDRNKSEEKKHGSPPPNSTIQLPFIIVNTSKKTVIDCSISSDKTEYLLNFNDTFEIHDDIEVLKRMGMALGLEKGECSPVDIEKAKSLVPKALESYVVDLSERGLKGYTESDRMSVGSALDDDDDATVDISRGLHCEGSLSSNMSVGGGISRHSSLSSLQHDSQRLESVSPSSFGEDEEDEDSELEVG